MLSRFFVLNPDFWGVLPPKPPVGGVAPPPNPRALVFQRVERAEFVAVEELPGSSRSDAGFGSSGRS